ncbi:MAG: 2-amino-4-hydroxy-6-hydroxymethyldihydropteridine diphosphokinase [Pseudomonadota bacterium]|nr:MAG: 2-amino-4-hydroxy-6-hydroxymethyldihydropteridine diphosphokinase [Pseudomonadota bacterium]
MSGRRPTDHSKYAWIGLGSNLQDPVNQVRTALVELDAIPDTHLVRHSRLYRSAPMGPADQPDYINAVAMLETTLSPRGLLDELRAIESRHGRVRGGPRWGPRTLDLDLLLFGERRIAQADLTVPHPGLHVRAFVLYPLVEIAPDLTIPGHGRVRDLADRCDGEGVEPLDIS